MKTCIISIFLQTKILWIDEKNLTACFECGIVGQDLERRVSMLLVLFPSSAMETIVISHGIVGFVGNKLQSCEIRVCKFSYFTDHKY